MTIDKLEKLLDKKFDEKLTPLNTKIGLLDKKVAIMQEEMAMMKGEMATKDDLKAMVTKDDLKAMVTKDDLNSIYKRFVETVNSLHEDHEKEITRIKRHIGLPFVN